MVNRTALVLGLLLCIGAPADELGRQMRKLVTQYGQAVIPIRLVIEERETFMGNEASNEMVGYIHATVIAEDGLAVTSLTNTNPATLYGMFMPFEGEDYSYDFEVRGISYLLPDNTELPARIVLRDEALDLAFLRPEAAPARPMVHIDFAKHPVGAPKPLDTVLELRRMNQAVRRLPTVEERRLAGILSKPRKLYVIRDEIVGSGHPYFMPTGELVGLHVCRSLAVSAEAVETAGVTLPARDLASLLDQAPVGTHPASPPDKDDSGERNNTLDALPAGEAPPEGE